MTVRHITVQVEILRTGVPVPTSGVPYRYLCFQFIKDAVRYRIQVTLLCYNLNLHFLVASVFSKKYFNSVFYL
jgi:hypothetical protein